MEHLQEILTKIREELIEAGKKRDTEDPPRAKSPFEAPPEEYSVKHPDEWHKLLFGLVCQSCGLLTYRKPIDGPTMSHVKATKYVFEQQVWPTFMNHGAVMERQIKRMMDVMIQDIYPDLNELTIEF
jgi:hypothetical protein